MTQVNHVIKTNDYSLFKTLEGNRIVNKLHVKRLKQSFQNAYLLSPILVSEKYQNIEYALNYASKIQSAMQDIEFSKFDTSSKIYDNE